MTPDSENVDRAHRIYLRGPWEWRWLSEGNPGGAVSNVASPKEGRAKLPASWGDLFGDVAGRATFRRRFHRPTNLEPREQVLLVFDGVGSAGSVSLNGDPLGIIQPLQQTAEFDITSRLAPSNLLEVDLEFDPAVHGDVPGGLWGPVALEIRMSGKK